MQKLVSVNEWVFKAAYLKKILDMVLFFFFLNVLNQALYADV